MKKAIFTYFHCSAAAADDDAPGGRARAAATRSERIGTTSAAGASVPAGVSNEDVRVQKVQSAQPTPAAGTGWPFCLIGAAMVRLDVRFLVRPPLILGR